MFLKIISLLLVVILSGCATVEELDFNKPLIKIPEKEDKKPKEEKVWMEAKTSKLWVNPHVDEGGDLVEGHYKHIVTEAGHWVIKSYERKQ